MTVTHLPCPYCNSEVLPPPGTQEGQRIPCPRCGESFVCRNLPDQPAGNGAAVAAPAPEPPAWGDLSQQAAPGREPTRANRIVALTVLAGMAVMATIGLIFAWLTVGERRAHDFPKTTEDDQTRAVLPADLAGLGYLPPGTAVVVAVDVAAALNDPAGREFLDHFRPAALLGHGRDEAANPPLPGLEQSLGLNLADLDHVVLGLNLEGRELPGVTLVARTRHPLEAKKAQIVKALDAHGEPALPRGKELYHVTVPKTQLPAFLWFADPTTLVLSLSRADLDALPAQPATGPARLAPAAREIVTTRVNGAAPQVWVAGHVEDWRKTTGSQMVLGLLAKEKRQTLEKVRDFDAWLRFDPGLTVGADCGCADAEAAAALEKLLVPAGPRPPLRVLSGRPETAAVAEELARSLKASRGEGSVWVSIQAKAGPETVRQALKPAR
jgi:hypothetical protein